jgi:hypothetical protein
MKQDDYAVVAVRVTDTSEAPKGKDLYYKCLRCGGIIPSQPTDNVGCECGNVFIDVDYFRLAIEDYRQFQVLRRISPAKKSR